MDLANAVVYDIETFPNLFTFGMECLNSDVRSVWEISEYRDDRLQFFQWLDWVCENRIPMIGFFNTGFDYPVVHFLSANRNATVDTIYAKAQDIIKARDAERNSGGQQFGNRIWERDWIAPQIDLFKIHHFDNKAKGTSLKALEVNMRSPTVRESRVPFGTRVQPQDVQEVIDYNLVDVAETKRFAHYSVAAINARLAMIEEFGIEALNYNDVKIGEKLLERRLGESVCYDRVPAIGKYGREYMRKQKRQTIRNRIALADIIFPYVQFQNPEFQRVLEFMRSKVLTAADIEAELSADTKVETKGVIKLSAMVGGLEFKFGTGGVHASVDRRKFEAGGGWIIRDIDVEGLYPNVAIVNQLAPQHLGEAFVAEYAKIPVERKTFKKGTYENARLKLAANGAWGLSNSKFSVFFDTQYAMTIPVNGQLMICMLVEWLLTVPTISLIQANTDGVTYMIREEYEPQAAEICRKWEAYTCLKLEDADYSHMWIRDVNNYVARTTDGKLKQKGAYWHPDPLNFADSISQASPPCWYKDFNPVVVPRAAVAAMVHGIDPELFIRCHSDPFDFMLRAKVGKADSLFLGDVEQQKVTRYYVARDGKPMSIVRPPSGPEGAFKRRNGVSEARYLEVMQANGWQWSEEVCTGKAGKPDTHGRYEQRRSAVQAGYIIAECNDARDFRFDNLNIDFYVNEAKKLIIA